MRFGFKNKIKTFSSFQRKAILGLFCVVVGIQLSYYFYKNKVENFSQLKMDETTKLFVQKEIDSLKQIASKEKIFPFNPNFIDDSKGYRLGMTVEQIDRLLAFRATKKYANSAKEFQKVTGVSDQWLEKYSPYFNFPEWTQKGNLNQNSFNVNSKSINLIIKDINKATSEDLIAVKGIGPAFAERIITERQKIGGFVHLDQLNFIWSLPPEAVSSLKKQFRIISKPTINKININTASKEEISKIPYITNQVARDLLIYRSKSDNSLKIEDLKKIKGFPLDKLNIIALYLDY